MQRGFINPLIIVILVASLLSGIVGYWVYRNNFQNIRQINSFEDCQKAGYPVGESYPPQCWTPDGKHFVQQLSDEDNKKLVPPKEPEFSGELDGNVYTSSKLNISVTLPENKQIKINEKNTGNGSCTDKRDDLEIRIYPQDYVEDPPETHFMGELLLSIAVVDSEYLPDQYINKVCTDLSSKIVNKSSIVVGGEKAFSADLINVMANQSIVIVQKGGKVYIIKGFSQNKQYLGEMFNTIVKSIKFLDDETLGWKTFETKEGEFALKYPLSWQLISENHGNSQLVTIKGKEGMAEFHYGNVAKYWCNSPESVTVTVKNGKVDTCHSITYKTDKEQTEEGWFFSVINLGDKGNLYAKFIASEPSKVNRNLVLEVISSFELLKGADLANYSVK